MDRGDPEQRIADLEGQLAEQKRGADLPPASPDRAAGSRRFVAVGGGGLGSRREYGISVTGDGLTVDGRPDEVFSFSDAQLGLWNASGTPGTATGTALHLRCGTRRFVLGGLDHRIAPGTRLEAPPVGGRVVDAVMPASDFDDLLRMVGHTSGLDIRWPAPGEPTRCLLLASPRGGPFAILRRPGLQASLAIDVSQDAIWLIDPNSNTLVASAQIAEVTAARAEYFKSKGNVTPVVIVGMPGTQPLTIGCPGNRYTWGSRFSWRGKVPSTRKPAYVVSAADWLTLVDRFRLTWDLEDAMNWG